MKKATPINPDKTVSTFNRFDMRIPNPVTESKPTEVKTTVIKQPKIVSKTPVSKPEEPTYLTKPFDFNDIDISSVVKETNELEEIITDEPIPKTTNGLEEIITDGDSEVIADPVVEEGEEISTENYTLDIKENDNIKHFIYMSSLAPTESAVFKKMLYERLKNDKLVEIIMEKYNADLQKLKDTGNLNEETLKQLAIDYGDIEELKKYEPIDDTPESKQTRSEIINQAGMYDDDAVLPSGPKFRDIGKRLTPNPKLADQNPVAFFEGLFGIGVPITISLPASKFSVTFRYPSSPEINKFNETIDNLKDTLGGALLGVKRQSVNNALLGSAVYELAEKLIVKTSLNVSNPMSYVLMEDMELIYLALLSATNPTGFPLTIPCINGAVMDPETGAPNCTNSVTGNVDPLDWIYMDTKNIPNMDLVIKVGRGVIELNEVTDALATVLNEPIIKAYNINNIPVEVTLKHLYAHEYFTNAQLTLTWIRENLLDSTDVMEPDISTSVIPFVESVVVNGNTYTGKSAYNLFTTLSKTPEGIDFIVSIRETINSFQLYSIGMPRYNCGCGAELKGMDGLLPINPLSLFILGERMKK